MQKAGAADTAGTGSCHGHLLAVPWPKAGSDSLGLLSPVPGKWAAELWASTAPAFTGCSLSQLPSAKEG